MLHQRKKALVNQAPWDKSRVEIPQSSRLVCAIVNCSTGGAGSAKLDEMDNYVSSLLLRLNRLAMPPADLHRRGLIASAIV
jgi:hypothetical protein